MIPTSFMLFVFYGFMIAWHAAWLWALFRTASDTLMSMINGEFTLKGVGWSAFCALLALIPLWIIALLWGEFLGVLPS